MTILKRPELLLLAVVAMLAPVIGGQVATEPQAYASPMNAIHGDASSVAAARLILGVFVFAALGLSFLRTRAVPLPRGRIVISMGVLLVALGFSAALSDFRAQSVEAFMLWGIAAAAFFATISVSGRKVGPAVLIVAMAVAGVVLGGRAVLDYFFIKDFEPTYRAFATWVNPNSVAGMYAILGIVTAGLIANENKYLRVLGFASSLMCGAGLALTQSKGGILAMGVGLVAWVIVHLAWKCKAKGLLAVLPLLLGFVIAFFWQTSSIHQAGGGGGGRILSGGAEAEQSQGFRTLLWKTAIELTKDKPITGWGPGTFRYESGRPGLQTPTANAHETFLQIAFEGGLLALAAFAFIAFAWFRLVFRGAKSLTSDQNALRAAVVGAIVAFGANGITESNLAFPGIGIIVFILLGIGLQLSSDGSSPELMPPTMRRLIVLSCCGLPLVFLALFAAGEARKSSIVSFAQEGETSSMLIASHDLESSMSYDGEALLLAGQYEVQDRDRRGRLLEQAAVKFPSPRAIRLYARWLADKPETLNTAITVLKRAFQRDPKNLLAWRLMIDLQEKAGNEVEARKAAEELVTIEGTSYFQVNALGDLVALEPTEARMWLARREKDPAKVVALLKPAVESYRGYLKRTVPMIKMMGKENQNYGGQSKTEAMKSLGEAVEAAKLLQGACQRIGDPVGAKAASSAADEFAAAVDDF
jgi:O-antigen ligase